MSRWQLINGDSRTELTKLSDNSIDSIVTDPPYELGFMGKSWDASGIAYDVNLWRECLRVLKPGGHILAFSGSRTYHRMAVAIEDAGFEIRDQIMWVYGSGFPKSLDVSKAIDKMDAAEEQQVRRYRFTAWVRSTGVTAKQIDQATATNMGGHYTTNASQPAIMTREHLEACRHLLGNIPEWVEREADIRSVESQNFASREVVGTASVPVGHAFAGETFGGDSSNVEVAITAPATDAAKRWDGWGTALKPAHEPIVLARKPLIGTVAQNVLTHGVGGLNIEASRIPSDDGFEKAWDRPIRTNIGAEGNAYISNGIQHEVDISANRPSGRWPANFIHDGSDEVLELFPEQKDSGSAARFFYCAKANKTDRNEGLDQLPERDIHRYGAGIGEGHHPEALTKDRNHHPTVKPTELMRYLCRLITPPNGIILDPFTGSGSTGKAAILEHFQFIGIEQQPDYITIAQARIQHTESTLQ